MKVLIVIAWAANMLFCGLVLAAVQESHAIPRPELAIGFSELAVVSTVLLLFYLVYSRR